jgi:hypothetical protein
LRGVVLCLARRCGNTRQWELANLQGGVDFRVAPGFTLGPYISVSFDEFTHRNDPLEDASISNKSIHEWLSRGIKGSFAH